MTDPLFAPISIGSLTIPNRIVRSATHDYRANPDGSVSEFEFELYTNLARGGIGLIVSGFIFVSESGRCSPGQLALLPSTDITSFRKLTAMVHENGGRIIAQLALGGRQTRRNLIPGPALVPSLLEGDSPADLKEMTPEDIEGTITDFVRAAYQSQDAGFDGVQLHAAHGYLLSQFLSPCTNRRCDEWGGGLNQRAKILLRMVGGIKETCGSDFPVLIKLNGDDGGAPEGLILEESVQVGKLLEQAGLDGIEVSRGIKGSPQPTIANGIKEESQEAYLLPLAGEMKKHVSIPVISVGGFRSASVMRRAIESGRCDLVAMSRPFIWEPDLVQKIRAGRERAFCVSCSKCFNPRGIECVQRKISS